VKRVFFVFLFLSLSLSEEQTKARLKVYENSLSRLKKNSPSFRRKSRVVSLRLFFFIFHFSHKNEKKKPNAFWSIIYPNRFNEERFLYISSSHTFSSPSLARLLSEARVDRSENTHAHSYTHTQSIIVSWRERCTCSPR